MLKNIEVPENFNMNHSSVVEMGPDNTGQQLIELVMRELKVSSLENTNILDIGCGVRFTQAIINRSIQIASYTGIEVNRSIVDYLKVAVEAKDDRFKYAHYNIENDMYNKNTKTTMSDLTKLPVVGKFDLIWLFSVFTHLNIDDTEAMLNLIRLHVEPTGNLFFSSFIDDDLKGFRYNIPEQPLYQVYYGLSTMKSLLKKTGWEIIKYQKRDFELPIVDYFVCQPA
ncbi:MAG: class I SAM-dependent methyltransferase [Alcanivoracaceae bacterium]|nr:class I SAM-dependent methyltransferase [Alcanivoracaceae bacterium]